MNLFDLTNQPTGLILGEYAGTPLYSVEDNYTYQYNGSGVIQRTSSGVETIKYSTDLAPTVENNIYQVTFDISLSQQPDTLGTESKIEFQTTIVNNGVTFFELSYDDLIQLNFGNPSTTFTAQYTATLSGESILQIKATEVGFYIQNIQVENLGVEEPDDEVLTPGGTTNDPYLRICLCDGTPNSNGSFKKDIQYWLDNDIDDYGFESTGYDSEVGFDTTYSYDEIPESMYPSNCIGYEYALFKIAQRYPEILEEADIAIFHDPSLCVFGGMELNTSKQNLIGLTWQDFVDNNLFGMEDNPIITRELSPSNFDPFIVFNKSGLHNDFQRASEGDLLSGEDSAIEATITYDLSKSNSNIYHPPIQWIGDGDGLNDGFDAIYRTFSNSYTGDYPDGVGEQHNPTYTTSENIFPIYDDIEDAPIRVETDPGPGDNWSDNNDPEETVWPGKCPAQFAGYENRYGFGVQTIGGFGPVMCDESHFDEVFDNWKTSNGDSVETPLIKPSNPSGASLNIDTNPDDSDLEIPIYANFPDNNTFNFIKQKLDETYSDTYKKYIKIFVEEPDSFSSIKLDFDGVITEIDLGEFPGFIMRELPDSGTEVDDVTVNGEIFKEQYGKILFTPASADFEKIATIKYQIHHYFINQGLDVENYYKIYTDHISGGEYDNGEIEYNTGYDGVRIYNYGSDYSINNNANFTEDLYNGHFNSLWNNIGPVGEDDGTENRFSNDNVRDVETGDEYVSDNYPNNYWSYEWDEQSYRSPARDDDNEYQNMIHWSYRYSFPFYSNNKSYLPDDLQSQDIGYGISDNEDPIDGLSISGTSHLPWPEQVIGRYDAYGDIIGVLTEFNGHYSVAYEVEIFITGTIQFSGDFGVPGFDVDLNPSLDKSYDPYSGIDLRPEIIDENICQHIEIMKIQNQGGDGLFYKIDIHPLIEDQSDEVQQITCDTNLNFTIDGFSMLRARCGDGSTILMADTGPGSNIDYTADYFYLSGINACKYASNHIRSYPNNKQFHFGANLDKRPSLGLFYYEEDNKASENFTGNLGEEFEQYPNTNLVQNSSGFLVDSYDTWFLDNNQDDSYHPQSWGIRYTDMTSTQVANYGAGHYEHLWDNYIRTDLIGVHHPRIASAMNNRGYNHNDYGGEDLDQFINHSSFDFNTRGYYRYTGYDSYFGSFYENTKPRYRGKNPRWIFEREDYVYSTDVEFYYVSSSVTIYINNTWTEDPGCEHGQNWNSCQGGGGGNGCGQAMDTIVINYPDASGSAGSLTSSADAQVQAEFETFNKTTDEFDASNDGDWWDGDDEVAFEDFVNDSGCSITSSYDNYYNEWEHQADYDEGTHPRCHSNGTCLNFNANQTLLNETSDRPYKHLTQWQELLTSEQATQLFYHDEQSTPDLKVSFWMYTDSNKVDDVSNPTFPEVEISITKIYPYDTWLNYNKHSAKGHLNSLSNPDNIAGSGRFKNTVLDEWEKFEFSFNLYYGNFYDNETRKFSPLYLVAQYSGVEVLDINANTPEERYEVVKGNVYLDDFSVTETGTFIPDVDVRAKKGEGNYGVGSLMEYYDPMIEEPIYYDNDGLPITQLQAYNDTTAPLEAQFYFYPRFFNEQVFDREDTLQGRFGDNVDGSPASFRNELVANDFRRGRFYLYDVDFGDGSEKEFTDEPLRLGNNTAVFHTYTKAGIYEITGYMLRTRPSKNEDGTPNHDEPSGVLNNKKVTVRININEGLDEDFTYFGSDEGFSYIPYKNTSPVIGGISKESAYYKAIKRQLGLFEPSFHPIQPFETFYGEEGQEENTEYLATLPFPQYFEEFDISSEGGPDGGDGTIDYNDTNTWLTIAYRKDIDLLLGFLSMGLNIDEWINSGPSWAESLIYPDYAYSWNSLSDIPSSRIDPPTVDIFFEKQSDKLKTEIALSKMDSSLNNQFKILPEFQIPRYSKPDGDGGELIYGGITTNKEELGKSLGNVDLTNVRFFNEPKEIYQMFGFTCDNNLSDIDLIPLGKPDYGLNFSNHSSIFTNVDEDDIQSPYFTNVSKVANQYENGSIITDQNAIRFGHDFRIDDIEGLGSGQWNHIDGAFVDTLAFNTPDLGYNQTYTYSTHIYIPFGYCEDGHPCSENQNQYTAMCSECNGIQQYDEGGNFKVRIVQNMNDSEMGANDWVHDLWHDDIVGGQWSNTHQLPTSETPGNKTSFKYKQFDAFNHCHPKGVNNPRFKYAWGNGKVFPIRDNDYCDVEEMDYQRCGLTNTSGDADGCYWEGDEDSGYCKAANLANNAGPPFNITCWSATTEGECVDGCEWYGEGSNNSNYETPIETQHEQIITDEWFRLDFPFTTKEPSEYGNHISLRFDTHLGVNTTTLDYPIIGDDLVTSGSFTESGGPNLDVDFLADLLFPSCFEEFDVANPLGDITVLDAAIWSSPEYARPDISAELEDIVTAGLSDEETVAALGGHCGEFNTLGVIAIKTDGSNQCIYKDPADYAWDDCQEYKDDNNFYNLGPNNTIPLQCCLYAGIQQNNLNETTHTQECEEEFQDSENYKSHKCQFYEQGSVQPIEDFINPTAGPAAEVSDWELYGNASTDNNNLKILFNNPVTTAEQYHLRGNTTYNKMYKLKYDVITESTEEDSKLLIVAREDGYVVGQSIELPTNTIGAQEVIFTSDNDTETEEDQDDPPRDDAGDNQEEDEGAGLSVFYERTLIIGHLGGYNNNDSVIIDNVELYEVTENQINTTTANEGLYTFGAQLLAGDFSGDNLINYTTEDLNPGDCADFEGGNPSNPRYWKNIIPSTYPFNYREGISDESLLRGGSLWPTPAMPDASDVWTYDTEDIEVVYKQNGDKLINTVKVGASNGGDGEEIKTTINGLYDHIVEDCDDWDSCVSLMDVMDLSQWYELKFTYYGTEEDVGGETNSSLKGVGIRMKKGSRIKADDWDRNTQGPNDGTTIVTVPAGHTMDMWIYGDAGNDYQQEQHPDFWVQANCTVGEECTVWILLLSSYYATTTTSHEFQLLNGQLYDRTTWGNFSLTRADVALGIVEWEDLLRRDMDYSSEQEWIGTNEYGNTYYYPVLPRFGFNGTFESANNQFYPGGDYDYPNDNIPFPIDAVVTEENPQEQSMLINIYNEQDETNVFKDGSGNNNNAFVINDYKPKYNEETSEPQSIKNVDRIRTSKDEGAF